MLVLFSLVNQHFFRPARSSMNAHTSYALSALDQEIMGVCKFCRSIVLVELISTNLKIFFSFQLLFERIFETFFNAALFHLVRPC